MLSLNVLKNAGLKKDTTAKKGLKTNYEAIVKRDVSWRLLFFPLQDSFPLFDQFLLSLPFEEATLISWKLEDKALQGMSFRFLVFFSLIRLGDPGVYRANHMAC